MHFALTATTLAGLFALFEVTSYVRVSFTRRTAMLHRVTISLDEQLASQFDGLIEDQRYRSRSEAVRDLVRKAVEEHRLADSKTGQCVASLSYIYDHHTRSLAQRLVNLQHDHDDIVVSTTHVHLDHRTCLETSILKGPVTAVRALSDAIKAERGVRFAEINLIAADPGLDEGRKAADQDHGANRRAAPHHG